MTKICFILDELYPADRGGIARLMHNVVHHAKSIDSSTDIHVVLARRKGPEEALETGFSGVATLHYFQPDQDIAMRFSLPDLEIEALFAQQKAPFMRELRILEATLAAEARCGGFDHIEIPDHMGLGAIILQAKQAGYAFQNTEITCRIHSSLSAITVAEPFHHARSDWLAPRLEMERFALGQADRVIAHLPTIARFNHTHFGFPDGWQQKVEIEFPPVIWPAPEAARKANSGKDFVFTSRFQPFKRPALFIKAAITLLDSGSDFSGQFRLISYGFSAEYIDYLRLMIPHRYRNRIVIQTNVSIEDRLAAISNGIIVQPSNFESLCALAYEASTANRPLLLARDCLAFGDDPHWKDGENCLMFDPTPAALAEVMEKARTWAPMSRVDTKPDRPYFLKPAAEAVKATAASIGIIVGPLESSEEMAAVSAHFGADIAQPVITFGYTDLEPESPDISYHRFTDADFNAAQWRDLAHSLDSDAVILCTPDALPSPDFIAQGAQIVAKGTAYSSNATDRDTGKLLLYPGKLETMSCAEYRICPPCLMLHRDDLGLIAPANDESLLSKLTARLARSDIALVLCPAPLVQLSCYTPTPPVQQLLAYEAEPVWKDDIRWIGVGVKPSINSGILAKHPIELELAGKTSQICSARKKARFKTGTPIAYALASDSPILDKILTIVATNKGTDNDIEVSLQQAAPKEALERHARGQNLRKLKAGQSYTMRWGPIWAPDPLTLVVSSKGTGKLHLANPILTSRA